jgi:hypothetical protein
MPPPILFSSPHLELGSTDHGTLGPDMPKDSSPSFVTPSFPSCTLPFSACGASDEKRVCRD